MDRNGNTNTKMMSAKEEIDCYIMSLVGKRVKVFINTAGDYSITAQGELKIYDGNRVIVDNKVCFLGPCMYLVPLGK
jgi:hypothetical protein